MHVDVRPLTLHRTVGGIWLLKRFICTVGRVVFCLWSPFFCDCGTLKYSSHSVGIIKDIRLRVVVLYLERIVQGAETIPEAKTCPLEDSNVVLACLLCQWL